MDYLERLFGLADKRIIVTGAGGFLGKAFAQALSGAGAKLYLLDVDEVHLRETCDSITCRGGVAETISCDITCKENVDSAVEKIADSGHIDALVNSAAIDPKLDKGKFEDLAEGSWFSVYPLEKWNSSLNVNLTGTFLVTQAVCRIMEKQDGGRGSIVNISSIAAHKGWPGRSAYGASKAAVLQYTKSVARYCGEQGWPIRCNAVLPGPIDTPMLRPNSAADLIPGGDGRAGASHVPMARYGDAEEVALPIVFLASDRASYITGVGLPVDGGLAARTASI